MTVAAATQTDEETVKRARASAGSRDRPRPEVNSTPEQGVRRSGLRAPRITEPPSSAGASTKSKFLQGRDKHTLVASGLFPDGDPYPPFLRAYNATLGGSSRAAAGIRTLDRAGRFGCLGPKDGQDDLHRVDARFEHIVDDLAGPSPSRYPETKVVALVTRVIQSMASVTDLQATRTPHWGLVRETPATGASTINAALRVQGRGSASPQPPAHRTRVPRQQGEARQGNRDLVWPELPVSQPRPQDAPDQMQRGQACPIDHNQAGGQAQLL